MVAWKTYRVSYIWSVNHTRKKVHQIYSQMIPPIQLIAPTMPILRITNLAAFTGFPNHRTSCSKPIPPAPPNPRQAPMILFTSLKIPCGDTFIEAYSQAARRPVKPLVGARLRMAVNKPHTTCAGFSTPRRQRRLIGNRIRTRVAHLRHLMSIGINHKDPTVRHVAQHGSFIRKRVLTRPNKSFVDYSSNFLCHSLRDPISQVISKGCHLSRDFVRIALKTWPELIHACRLNAIDQLNGVCRSRNKEAYSQPSSSAL